MKEKDYKVSVLISKDEFADYADVLKALYPDPDQRATFSELRARLQAHLGRRVK